MRRDVRAQIARLHIARDPKVAANSFRRITIDPAVMGGKPCIRGMRVTVGMIVEFDCREALAFAASLAQGREVHLAH